MKYALIVLAIAVVAVAGFLFLRRHRLSFDTMQEYAIGIYSGHAPNSLSPDARASNPVITRTHVRDVPARFVADPFIARSAGTWYMFYEVLNSLSRKGEIGMSWSPDGLRWNYGGIVLAEPYHLSYPYVFSAEGRHYLVPESIAAGRIRLYSAQAFPRDWRHVADLLEGEFADTSLFCYDGLWWMFSSVQAGKSDELRLYYAESLPGPWVSHPRNPIVQGDSSIARPGGRVVVTPQGIVRFAQDGCRGYGKSVRAIRIVELSRTSYREEGARSTPIVRGHGTGWERHGMHHVDPVQMEDGTWLAAVDGFKKHLTIHMEY